MRGRAWLVLVVILAVVAVFAAKEAIKERPAATMRGADSRPQEAAPGAPAHPSAEGKPEGPLPGSKLAECLKSGRPTMADFGKGWCQPCKMMVPVLERAASDYSGKANIVFVDMEQYDDLARMFRISVMPTQIFFDAKGHEVTRHIGYMSGEDIDSQIARLGVRK